MSSLARSYRCTPQTLGGRIGRAFALDDAVDVDVIPLINDDTVTVLVRGCSGRRAVRHVDKEPGIGPFTVTAPVDQDRSVLVSDLVPGCLVDVLVDGRWAGSTPAAVPSIRVGVVAPLRAGQRVAVVVRLCEQRRVSQPVTVRSAPPVQWEQPTNGGLALDNNNFRAGRVEAVLTLGGGSLLCGTEASGLWGIGPGGPATSLSTDWPTPLVRSMARGPRGNQHI